MHKVAIFFSAFIYLRVYKVLLHLFESPQITVVKGYIETHKDRFLQELIELLKLPSISANSDFDADVKKTAEFLKNEFIRIGLDNVAVYPTKGHPVVYAEKIIDSTLPTILVYGHYDVQPADPLELWASPPFEPVIKKTEIHPDGAIFARGACDDKGQMYMHVKAVEAMLSTNQLACNVKFMIEGEEEVGSENLEAFISEKKELLSADVILVSDTGMLRKDIPSVTVGLRGLSYLEVEVTGPNRDLHSGLYGGAVANPINILCDMISSLHDENRRITIPGFYDEVYELSTEMRAEMAKAPYNEDNYKKALNIQDVCGEEGFSTVERATIRPTLDVNGIWGGYTGVGAKTVIPSQAFAKISMRLVPNQDPDKITQLFQKHFESIAPKSVIVKVKPHHGGHAAMTPTDSVEYQAASLALEESFGMKPIPIRSGGSIPIIAMFEKVLGLKTILLGFGLDSDAIHSPNEHFGLHNFYKGIESIPLYYKYYAQLKMKK